MKSSRKFTFIFAVMLGLIGFFHSAWAQEGPPVKLTYAYAKQTDSKVCIHARVYPLGNAAAQAVYVHYKQANGVWADARMGETMGGINYGFRGFKAVLNASGLEFVIKYETSAGTFWDNNNGANYKITGRYTFARGWKFCDISATDKVNVEMAGGGNDLASPYATLLVRNLGHAKRVGIRYTTDNWVHTGEIFARYVRPYEDPNGQIEEWMVDYPRVPAGKTMEFAAFCQDLTANAVYWDNNFGQNYRLNDRNWGAW